MKRYVSVLILCLAQLGLVQTAPYASPKISKSDLREAMRKLWGDHITRKRGLVIDAAGVLPD